MHLELVSFKICPFVQRCVITLMLKDEEFDTTFINLMDPPEWFKEISPLGKVPVLKVGNEVLFESAVINEYLDETVGEPLMPSDPMTRAKHRGWIELGSNAIMAMFNAVTAKEEEGFEAGKAELARLIDYLDRHMDPETSGPYFAGHHLSLVDTSFAPLFQRLRFLEQFEPLIDLDRYPQVSNWAEHLEKHPIVESSLPDDFAQRYRMSLKGMGGYYAKFLGED